MQNRIIVFIRGICRGTQYMYPSVEKLGDCTHPLLLKLLKVSTPKHRQNVEHLAKNYLVKQTILFCFLQVREDFDTLRNVAS